MSWIVINFPLDLSKLIPALLLHPKIELLIKKVAISNPLSVVAVFISKYVVMVEIKSLIEKDRISSWSMI